MPGQLKEVRNRIKSVQNTQQITKAMKMVSAAKLRKATDRIIKMRPYSNKLNEMLSNIASGSDVNIEFAKPREVKNALVVVVTSDRGLAGGFNSNIIKIGKQTVSDITSRLKGGKVTVLPIGKKAHDNFKKGYPVHDHFAGLFNNLNFDQSSEASEWMFKAFTERQFDQIDIVYSQFKNAATQVFKVERFLPVMKSSGESKSRINYIFEPDQESLVNELVPKILKTQFFKVLLDSNASEHGARMTAMDKATENAKDILKELSIRYNRERQAAITTELTEIVSGAAALQGQ